MSSKQLIYSLILILISSQLFGQADLRFEYKSSDEFVAPVHSVIRIHHPNGMIDKLLSDTLKSSKSLKEAYFGAPGNYLLTIYYSNKISETDSVDYNFTLNGNESDVSIKVSLDQDIKTEYKSGNWIETKRKNKGYISVTKYYNSPKTVTLTLGNAKQLKSPVLKINNFSKDTIYGEYLPGYFWGCISNSFNGSNWSRKRCGRIDTNFSPLPPLYPDSSRITTVGSFGRIKLPITGLFRYVLLFSTTGNSHGHRKYLNSNNIEWWAMTEEFYRLVFERK